MVENGFGEDISSLERCYSYLCGKVNSLSTKNRKTLYRELYNWYYGGEESYFDLRENPLREGIEKCFSSLCEIEKKADFVMAGERLISSLNKRISNLSEPH